MNKIQELRIHVEALNTAIDHNEKFFASIVHYARRLRELLVDGPNEISQQELKLLTDKIEEFFRRWRPSPEPSPGVLYIPPRETADADGTILEINRLTNEIAEMQPVDFQDQLLYQQVKQANNDVEVSVVGVAEGPDPRKVFVVYGRNEKARAALFAFLRSINLDPREWSQWVAETAQGSPYVGEILKKGFQAAQAFVVLMTPDDEARLREALRGKGDEAHEVNLTPQPRPNVIYEAGMAMGIDDRRTILIELGRIRPISDILGRHVVRIDNTPQRRKELAQRLETAGCSTDTRGNDWLIAGDFDAALEGL